MRKIRNEPEFITGVILAIYDILSAVWGRKVHDVPDREEEESMKNY